PLQSLFFSFRSLQTVCAFVMRFGTGGAVAEAAVTSVAFADIGAWIGFARNLKDGIEPRQMLAHYFAAARAILKLNAHQNLRRDLSSSSRNRAPAYGPSRSATIHSHGRSVRV